MQTCPDDGRPVVNFRSVVRVDVHYNDPTILALCGLIIPHSAITLDSFFKAGGVGLITQLVGDTSRPLTFEVTAALVMRLMRSDPKHGDQQLHDEFWCSGEWGDWDICRMQTHCLECTICLLAE